MQLSQPPSNRYCNSSTLQPPPGFVANNQPVTTTSLQSHDVSFINSNMQSLVPSMMGESSIFSHGPNAPPLISFNVDAKLGTDGFTNFILVVASDGVWEFMNEADVREIVMQFPREQAHMAAEAVAKQAWDRWYENESGTVVDDITCLVVYI